MPSGREIIERAGQLLLDEDYTRWTLPEHCSALNEAVRAIIMAKPSASTETRVLQLAAGTLQSVPSGGSPAALMLVNIVRNLKTAADSPRIGGRIVTPTSSRALDAAEPYWHDPDRVRQKKEVRHFIFDERNPLEFYVYPGNDGTGIVEAVVATLPAPLVASGDVDDIASYEGDVGLPEPWSVPLLDYVLYRAQSKDDLAAEAGRAQAHYQAFAAALGIKIRVEGGQSPNARRVEP